MLAGVSNSNPETWWLGSLAWSSGRGLAFEEEFVPPWVGGRCKTKLDAPLGDLHACSSFIVGRSFEVSRQRWQSLSKVALPRAEMKGLFEGQRQERLDVRVRYRAFH
ncbi:uncharacterized protein K452DRAFT_289334 [Aplosporella prunicola CBS 121167]|uniref:Uncharacterized protein n=1 Tax=Aplosporella prunicola CBS 121167 TaxID=1176127 RepID=A0A6A6B9P8_9PEZI|nr:uncharacterized protein K452DRAFT_289334 [Aplosporella prunicola CBS 121167]KAF2139954.1 hypothetical protein K452DRAFT_289334 [Aplosporella prunicola CBS 121167]